ncbi:hypothetical protein [Paradevosia shaoguanensis]|uniref:Uncharacterized protein n=1 Tax=Paradevosia shaoguanensis TaxID=1335043 RepID=A0AA41QQV5_9HYPH|nr:hypothetical protein [Paradevosia shaoguanensis]MCF1744189.1 hypothetical protein [Paradevosia shaoguanensis]MCI0128672.1 hypothetical protein [Paradevosia shaoguanensis]
MDVIVDYEDLHGGFGADGERRVTAKVEIIGLEGSELRHVRLTVAVDVAEPESGTLRDIESAVLEAAASRLRSAASLSLRDLQEGLLRQQTLDQPSQWDEGE